MQLVFDFSQWLISPRQGVVGRQYDNLSHSLVVDGELPSGYTWDMLVEAKGKYNIIPLSATATGATASLTADQLAFGNTYYAFQLRGTSGEVIHHTNAVQVYVPDTIVGPGTWPVLPTEFSQAEANIKELNAHPPVPGENGYWLLWDLDTHGYVQSQLVVPGLHIEIGKTTTGEPGTPASVTNSGTNTAPVLNFTIPEGEKGDTGPQGEQGPKGDQGPQGEQGPKGDTGAQGEPGTPGAAAGFGNPTATIDAATGTPSVTVEASGPDTAKVFAFSFHNLKGADGAKGEQGDPGPPGEKGEKGDKGDAGSNATINGVNALTIQATNGIVGTMSDGTYKLSGENFLLASLKGATNGLAELDTSGHVPTSQLPSYVDDVLEYSSKSAFPPVGSAGIIYVAIDTNLTYRWGGSEYVEISPSLALGETSATAYRGDRGKTAYDHSQVTSGNPHGTTAADIGAQTKLTGTQGQVVGFDSSGNAIAQKAPSGLPDGGAQGQLLAKGTSDAEWIDNPSLAFGPQTVASSAWAGDSTYPEYPYRASVTLAGVTANHAPVVNFSSTDSLSGKLSPVADSYAGGVYIYATEAIAETVNIGSIICIKAVGT